MFRAAIALACALSWLPFALAQSPIPSLQPRLSEERLLALDKLMADYVHAEKVEHLSYGVWQYGALRKSGYYGLVQPQSDRVVSETTIHRIQSMTKPVTAVGLLILMERGDIDLNDPITNYLPEFETTEILADRDSDGNMFTYRSLRPPNIAQLLSHTAGLAYGADRSTFLDEKLFLSRALHAPDTDTLVRRTAAVPYQASPGEEWIYSIASDLQGAIIERITGEKLDVFLQREVFRPLGMQDTRFHVPSGKDHRLASVSKATATGLMPVDAGAAGIAAQSGKYVEGGHGLFSTLRDYQRFAQMLCDNGRFGDQRLLREDTVKQLRTNAIRNRGRSGRQGDDGRHRGRGYGFGVGTLEDPVLAGLNAPPGTIYWTGALGSWFWVDPENQIIFVGMIQSRSVPGEELLSRSMNSLYDRPLAEQATAQAP